MKSSELLSILLMIFSIIVLFALSHFIWKKLDYLSGLSVHILPLFGTVVLLLVKGLENWLKPENIDWTTRWIALPYAMGILLAAIVILFVENFGQYVEHHPRWLAFTPYEERNVPYWTLKLYGSGVPVRAKVDAEEMMPLLKAICEAEAEHIWQAAAAKGEGCSLVESDIDMEAFREYQKYRNSNATNDIIESTKRLAAVSRRPVDPQACYAVALPQLTTACKNNFLNQPLGKPYAFPESIPLRLSNHEALGIRIRQRGSLQITTHNP